MKKIIFLLICNFVIAQNIQLKLQPGHSFPGVLNDIGFNQILANYNIYAESIPTDCSSSYQDLLIRSTSSTNMLDLLNELNNYQAVVKYANFDLENGAVNCRVLVKILSAISFTGVSNSIVQTSNASLNTIFQNFGVDGYCQAYPTSNCCADEYIISCNNCNAINLKNAIINLQNTTPIYASNYPPSLTGYGTLGIASFETKEATIYPNPFTTTFAIESQNEIKNYSLTDVLGKQLVITETKTDLDKTTSALIKGTYFLIIAFENSKQEIFKLIKN